MCIRDRSTGGSGGPPRASTSRRARPARSRPRSSRPARVRGGGRAALPVARQVAHPRAGPPGP
eukprot:1888033-Alexandrium_andersonii.AAC.1